MVLLMVSYMVLCMVSYKILFYGWYHIWFYVWYHIRVFVYACLYVLSYFYVCFFSMLFLGVQSPLPGRTIFRNLICQNPFLGGSLPYRGEPFSEIPSKGPRASPGGPRVARRGVPGPRRGVPGPHHPPWRKVSSTNSPGPSTQLYIDICFIFN